MRRRGGYFGLVPGGAAISLLVALSFSSLCLCSDEQVLVQPFLEGCGLAAQGHAESASSAEPIGDECLGPCIDVRVVAAGAPGDERPASPEPGFVAALHGSVSDRSRLDPLPARPRERLGTAGHLNYTILRC